jgi:hypothetical protein
MSRLIRIRLVSTVISSVDTIRDLAAGPERDRIEAATNQGAGWPYATLSTAERSRLVSGLTALPGEP